MYKKIVFTLILLIFFWCTKLKYNIFGYNYLKTYRNYKKRSNITLISYNIGLLPFNIKNLNILEKILINYDIILLQEFFTNLFFNKKNWLLNFCKDYKYNIVAKEESNIFFGKLVDSGLVILSKYPIVKVRKFNFDSKSSSYDSLVHKGFLNALIQIGNKKISIYNLHNQSFYQKFVNPNFIQNYQLKKLNDFINTNDKYIIVGGDFNIESQYTRKYIKTMKIYDSKYPTIYVKYDKNNIEQSTNSEEKEHYTPYYLDYFLTKNVNMQVKSHANIFSDHKYLTSFLIFK